MGYPIQEGAVIDYVQVLIAGVNVTDYVTDIGGSIGSEPDAYFCNIQPGNASVKLYDITSTVEGYLVPGQQVKLRTIPSPGPFDYTNYFVGTIRNVVISYEYNQTLMRLVPVASVEAVDLSADLANIVLKEYSFAKTVGAEKISVASFGSAFATATGYTIVGASALTSTYINQFVKETNALEALNLVARSIDKFVYPKMDPALSQGDYGLASTSGGSASGVVITDGTHTGSPTYLWKMTGLDYGYSSDGALSEVNLNNVGLNRAPKAAKDRDVVDVVVPYQAKQSIGFDNALTMDTVVATDNLGWNYILNNAGVGFAPELFSRSFFKYQAVTTRTKDDYPYSTRCIVNATYTAGTGLIWSSEDDFPDMVTTPAGGTTGNWYFRFYAQAHSAAVTFVLTPVISWYDAQGQFLSSSTGTGVTINSATTWQAVTVNAAKPTNATSIRAYFTVGGTVRAVGNSFYVTDAYLGQQGAYLSFNGDTPDTASYLYTWTGERGHSPSQRNTNSLVSLGSTILARNTVAKKVKSVTLNMFEDMNSAFIFSYLMQLPTSTIAIWVDGVSKTYIVGGYDFDLTPTSFELTLKVIEV